MTEIHDAIERLRALKFDVMTQSERTQDAAVCMVLGSGFVYKNPRHIHEIGWSEAAEKSKRVGDNILGDIATVCDEVERLLKERDGLWTRLDTMTSSINFACEEIRKDPSGKGLIYETLTPFVQSNAWGNGEWIRK